jgi:hypothetical protein
VRPVEAMLVTLVEQGHRSTADGLLDVARNAAAHVGAQVVGIYLVDMEQRQLQPIPGSQQTQPYAIDTTLPGRAYRSVEPVETTNDGGRRMFVPLLDGTARLGVIELETLADGAQVGAACGLLAKLVAELLVTKQPYGDVIHRTRRRKEMRLAAEIQWELLPPLTLETPRVTISGILEPSYEVAGDAFDYAANGDTVHVLLVDAMGHGLDSSLISTLVVGAFRHSRRRGDDLGAIYAAMDGVVADRFGPDRFATAQLALFDSAVGTLWWINAGHPPPLLVRDKRVVGRLDEPPVLPLGFGDGDVEVSELQLQPGDAVLWFTDGLVEARSPGGEFFGEERLEDLLTRALHSGEPIPEVVRRLTHAVLDHHAGTLRDDATLLFLEWKRPAG